MFRILVVDDSPSVEHILREVAKDLRQPAELAFVADGEEALDFLHRRGDFAQLANRDHDFPASRLKPDDPGSIPMPSLLAGGRAVSGPQIASDTGEDASRAMEDAAVRPVLERPRRAGCEEHDRLLDRFGTAVQEILKLHEQQYRAIVDGDEETERFDLLIHMANENKQAAKYDYLQHAAIHGCN